MPITNLELQGLFTSQAMTEAMYRLPVLPTQLMASGLFGAPILLNTTYFNLEIKDRKIGILNAVPRGGVSNVAPYVGSKIETLQVPHIPIEDRILASQIQDIRQFGSDVATTNAQQVINDHNTAKMTAMNATIEYHMLNAMMGVLKNPNGQVLHNYFDLAGVSQQVVDFGTVGVNVDITEKIIDVFDAASGIITFSTMKAFCGKNAFKKLQTNKEIISWRKSQPDATAFSERSIYQGFTYEGVYFELYNNRADTYGADFKIPDNEIYFVPNVAAGELFGQAYAPGTSADAINRQALPYYASVVPMDHNEGWMTKHQTNALCFPKNPDAIIKATLA